MENNLNTSQILIVSSVKRIHGRAIVSLSNGESLTMPQSMLRERPYRSGMPFDRSAFDAFLAERAYPFAMEKAIALLASRSRTEKEIEESLKRNAYPEKAIARVMARLIDAGYLDDADFAANWAASRTGKGIGPRRIRMELRQKGVSLKEIDDAVSSINTDDALNGAIRIAEKASRGKDLSSPADRQKIIAALARRGFDFSIAKQALQSIIGIE